jgi:hypothetical protein
MNPRITAYLTTDKIMEKGLAQGHLEDGWATEDPRFHLLKAIRHLSTQLLILDGLIPEDGEDHSEHALCRIALALSQESDHGADQ